MSRKPQKPKVVVVPPKKQIDNSDLEKQLFRWTLAVLGITLAVMSPALRNGFVSLDDFVYITENPLIRSLSWNNIKQLFNLETAVAGNYHPLTVLTLAIEYKFAGLNPFLYHFDNILLHLFNISLVTTITWLMTRKLTFTLIVTILFAIHPMRIESVVWAAERKDVLYVFFFLLSVLQYVRYVLQGRQKKSLLVWVYVFFILSLLSKGQAVVLPIVLVLIDFWFEGKFSMKGLISKIPFFALALLFGYLATSAQSSSLTEVRLTQYSLFERIQIASYGLLAYVYKLILPLKLGAFYGYPPKSEWLLINLSPFVVIVLLGLLFYRFRTNRVVVFGCLFFLGTVFIVLQLLPVGDAIIADRYTYLPYFGLFFILGYIGDNLMNRQRQTAVFLGVGLVLVLAVKSYKQSLTWRSSEDLYLNILEVNPKEAIAHNNLGAYYIDKKDYSRAIDHLQKCIAGKDNYPEVYKAYSNLGKAYLDINESQKALQAYSDGIALEPRFTDLFFGRGLAYTKLGQYDKAVADFDEVLKTRPLDARAWYSRGLANQTAGKADEAIRDYTKAIELQNNFTDAYNNRGNIYFVQGKTDEAIKNYNEGIRLNPTDGNIWLNRSKAWMVKADPQKAVADMRQAELLKVSEPGFKAEVEAAVKMQATQMR